MNVITRKTKAAMLDHLSEIYNGALSEPFSNKETVCLAAIAICMLCNTPTVEDEAVPRYYTVSGHNEAVSEWEKEIMKGGEDNG